MTMEPDRTVDAHRNPDGTYNGVAIMAELSGLTQAEVAWTFGRLKQLMTIERRPREEAKAIVQSEARSKPWLSTVDKPAQANTAMTTLSTVDKSKG